MKPPKKRDQKEKQQENVNAENVCRVLPGNYLKTKKVTLFGLSTQERQVNIKVLLSVNMSAAGGCITDVQIFTMKTLTPEKEQCQLEQRNISSVKNICRM